MVARTSVVISVIVIIVSSMVAMPSRCGVVITVIVIIVASTVVMPSRRRVIFPKISSWGR